MTNQDHVWQILDDALLLLAGQGYPTPERTYKLDGGWSLALADLKRCFGELRAKLAAVEAERDAARAGEARAVEVLRAAYDAAEEWHGSVEWEGREHTQAVIDACEAVLVGTQPALDWLAQQRAEAAEAAEKNAKEENSRGWHNAFAELAAAFDCDIEIYGSTLVGEKILRLKAALLAVEKEAAALRAGEVGMMRSRPAVEWVKVAGSDSRQMALYRGWLLEVGEGDQEWNWLAESGKGGDGDEAPTLEAAQAAAISWVDEQESKG